MNPRLTRLMAPLALAGLVACAHSPQAVAPEPVLPPNANLVVQGKNNKVLQQSKKDWDKVLWRINRPFKVSFKVN